MTSYVFQGSDYRNGREMMAAMMREWLWAGETKNPDTLRDLREYLARTTDEAIINELDKEWGPSSEYGRYTEDELEEFDPQYFDRAELLEALADLRTEIEDAQHE